MWDVSEKPETRKNDQGIQDQRAENRLGTNRNQTKSGLINNKDYIRPNDDWSKNLCTEMDKRAFEGDGEGKEKMLLGVGIYNLVSSILAGAERIKWNSK